jgi:hypothetical protein
LATHTSSTGIYFDGEPPDSPAGRARSVFMDRAGIDFNSGHVFRIDLAYDSSAHVLTETVTDTVTNAVFTTSYMVHPASSVIRRTIIHANGYRRSRSGLLRVLADEPYSVDIAAHLGSNAGYVGFGGGTGGETAVQDILTWTYHSGAARSGADDCDASPAATVSGPAAADGGPAPAVTAAPAPAGGAASAAAIAAPHAGGGPGSGGRVAGAGTAADGSRAALVDLAIADGDAEAPWFSLAGLTRAGRRRSPWLTTSP